MKKILWIDLETTDSDTKRGGGVWQLAYILDVNGSVVKEDVFNMSPFPNDLINVQSLNATGMTYERVMSFPHPSIAYKHLLSVFSSHGPVVLGGFNNAIFDSSFFYSWWYKCANYEKSSKSVSNLLNYMFFDPLDVRVLAIDHLLDKRKDMTSFKLGDVARWLEIEFDDKQAHNALYDIQKTREIYYKIKQSR